MIDPPGSAGASDGNVLAAFELMNCRIHRLHVNPQQSRNPALPDLDGRALVHIPRQHSVDAARGNRQSIVKEHRFRHSGVVLCRALFGFSVHFLFGFSVHVI